MRASISVCWGQNMNIPVQMISLNAISSSLHLRSADHIRGYHLPPDIPSWISGWTSKISAPSYWQLKILLWEKFFDVLQNFWKTLANNKWIFQETLNIVYKISMEITIDLQYNNCNKVKRSIVYCAWMINRNIKIDIA